MTFIIVHVRNSLSQLVMVDRGAMMRKGPLKPMKNISYRNVMDWMVFPRPISSARIQFFLHAEKWDNVAYYKYKYKLLLWIKVSAKYILRTTTKDISCPKK